MLWNRVSFKHQNINKQIKSFNIPTGITGRIYTKKRKMLCYVDIYV